MAYFYVKSSLGTRTTGGGLTKQTGSFATLGAGNVYATVALAIADGATAGDFIIVSDAHAETSSGAHVTWAGPTSGVPLKMVSVDDANCDQYKAATTAQSDITTAHVLYANGLWDMYGMYLKQGRSLMTGVADGQIRFYNGKLETSITAYPPIYLNSTHTRFYAENSTISCVSFGYLSFFSSGCQLEMVGCSVSGVSTTIIDNQPAGFIRMTGCDLSGISGALVNNYGDANSDREIICRVDGCKLHASVVMNNVSIIRQGIYISVSNSASSSSAAEYQYGYSAMGGTVEDETSIYRDGSTAFPSGTKISLKCVTDANTSQSRPFVFNAPTRYAALSSTASDTITVYILSSATLTDRDVWVDVSYPDGTNKHVYNFLSAAGADVLGAGTTLTTNTEAWTGRTTENRYQIDLNTSGDAGADCVPIVRVYVTKPSATIYFCPTLGLS